MSTRSRSLIALIGAVLLSLGVSLGPISTADATGGSKPIEAKALTDHGCDSSEWHFVITQVDSESNAPASIMVNWANGDSESVPLDKFTGGVAHYATTSNLDSTVTSATTSIYDGWSGQFNLSHGPCGEQPPPPVEPEGSNNSSSPSCEKITVGTPTGVMPEDATVVIKLDGEVTQPGTYDATPGTHVVTTYVNGVEVDKDTVTVEKCAGDQPDDKVTYSEWKDGDKSCESKTVTQTRTKTVTPYKWNGSEWVLDTANATSTTETRTRPMTEEELKECEGTPPPDDSCPPLTGSVKTTLADGSVVNGNIYTSKSDVYVSGSQLGDVTTVYIRVTDPSGSTVLSDVKQVSVTDGSFGPVQLPTFSDTPNNGDEYKVWVSSTSDFEQSCTKFDNFKVRGEEPPPPPEGTSKYDVDCEALEIKAPTGVMPEDAEYQYYLDGEAIEVGSHELAPGEYTLTLEVNGEQVDSDTFVVEECEEETTPVSPTEPTSSDVCEPESGTTNDRINGLSDANFTYQVDGTVATASSFVATGTSHVVKAIAKEDVVIKEGAKTEWTFTFTKVKCVTTTETPSPTPTPTPTEMPTTPTETPTTPTDNPTPTTPTETPTPTVGMPTSTSVPTPTSTPSIVPPDSGATGAVLSGGVNGNGGATSFQELMSRIALLSGLGLMMVAFWPRRRRVNI